MHFSKLLLVAATAVALSACGTLSNSSAPVAQPAVVKKAPVPPAPPGGKPAPELTPQDIQRIQQQLNKQRAS